MAEPGPVRDGRTAARDFRDQHNLGTAPIADLFGLIETVYDHTLVIRIAMPDGPEGALVRSGADLLLIVNTDERLLARQRFTAAHELGHQHFDSSADTTFVERNLFGNDAREMRANAFAVNLLLPLKEVQDRIDKRQLDVSNDEQLIELSLEFGISLASLGYHLKNNNFITDRRRLELTRLQPLKLASALGHYDRTRAEFDAKGVTRWPRRFVKLALEAERADALPGQIQQLLQQDDSAKWTRDTAREIDLFAEADTH